MSGRWCFAAGLLLIAMVGGAPAAAQEGDNHVVHPLWTHRPTAEDLHRLYPRKVHGVTGEVILNCTIDDNGRFGACDVVKEEPGGQGFGEATIRLSRLFQMRTVDGDGSLVAGRTMHLPVKWWAGFGE